MSLSLVSEPFVFARRGHDDLSFSGLAALAAAIHRLRCRVSPGVDLMAIEALLARDPLPGGRVVCVRLVDGALAGRGTVLGYAFMPGYEHNRGRRPAMAPHDLMDAVDRVAAAAGDAPAEEAAA